MQSSLLCVLISGPPGVGKSTLAFGLARKLRLTWLDKDAIDEPFSPNDRGPRYTRVIEPKVLTAILNLAALNLRAKQGVLLDVPWTHILINSPQWIKRIQSLCRAHKAKLLVLECTLPETQLRERMRQRNFARDRKRLTPAGWKRFQVTDKLGCANPLPHHVISMDRSKAQTLKSAVKIVRESI